MQIAYAWGAARNRIVNGAGEDRHGSDPAEDAAGGRALLAPALDAGDDLEPGLDAVAADLGAGLVGKAELDRNGAQGPGLLDPDMRAGGGGEAVGAEAQGGVGGDGDVAGFGEDEADAHSHAGQEQEVGVRRLDDHGVGDNVLGDLRRLADVVDGAFEAAVAEGVDGELDALPRREPAYLGFVDGGVKLNVGFSCGERERIEVLQMAASSRASACPM